MPERWKGARPFILAPSLLQVSFCGRVTLLPALILLCTPPKLPTASLCPLALCNAAPRGKVGAKAAASAWDPPGIAEKPGQRSGGGGGIMEKGELDARCATVSPDHEGLQGGLWGPCWGLASDGEGSCTGHFRELHGTR